MKKQALAVGTALSTLAGSAFAAVPTEVTTALTDGKADVMTVAGAAIIILIGVAVFKYMRKGV